jgi:HEAT repeat protein
VIPRLAEALASEERPRARQRLTQLLISFGEHGRHSVDQLRRSPSASVRRTAVQLLRSFGGREALGEIAEMLEDREVNVQRESVRALIGIGTTEAYEVLEKALSSETSRARSALMQELGATRDERATPLLCFIVLNMECRGYLREVYLKALARLGVLGGPESVEALKQALSKGQWWAPWRWREVWNEAAASLVRMNTAEALQALGEAASRGPLGARRVARRHLKAAGTS